MKHSLPVFFFIFCLLFSFSAYAGGMGFSSCSNSIEKDKAEFDKKMAENTFHCKPPLKEVAASEWKCVEDKKNTLPCRDGGVRMTCRRETKCTGYEKIDNREALKKAENLLKKYSPRHKKKGVQPLDPTSKASVVSGACPDNLEERLTKSEERTLGSSIKCKAPSKYIPVDQWDCSKYNREDLCNGLGFAINCSRTYVCSSSNNTPSKSSSQSDTLPHKKSSVISQICNSNMNKEIEKATHKLKASCTPLKAVAYYNWRCSKTLVQTEEPCHDGRPRMNCEIKYRCK